MDEYSHDQLRCILSSLMVLSSVKRLRTPQVHLHETSPLTSRLYPTAHMPFHRQASRQFSLYATEEDWLIPSPNALKVLSAQVFTISL